MRPQLLSCIPRSGGTALLVCVAFLTGPEVHAQISGTGTIQGVVTDSSGAAVPSATVVATNTQTGVKTTRQTTDAGYYTIAPLNAGQYSVEVAATGFQKAVQQNVTVDALAQVTVNITMQVGAASQEVTVTSAPPPLNTSDASMSQTLPNEVYGALPLAMGNAPRDPTAFTQYLPGVTTNPASTGNTAGNVLGGQEHSAEIYVEGLPTTNPSAEGESRTLGLGVSVEAVDQFQLETAGTSVEYQGQGASNYVIKSGTNHFHGEAFEYLRNTAFDARGFFAPTTPTEHQNEFGFNVGGPVMKNKLFFFANYDGFRFTQQAQPALASLPTAAERGGDFSALLASNIRIYDPQSTTCNATGVCTRTPFPNNVIPANRLSPISQSFQSYLPATNNNNLQSNYLQQVPIGYHDNSTTDKVDFNLNEKNTFFVLFSHGHRSQTTPYRSNVLPLPYGNTRLVDEYPTTAIAKWTYVATATLVNQLTYGLSRFSVPQTSPTISGNYPVKAGLTGLPPGQAGQDFPTITFSGPESPDPWRGTNSQIFNDTQNTFTLQDNVQWTKGKHSMVLGGQIMWLQANEKEYTYGSIATWTFTNNQTAGFGPTGTLLTSQGNAYASYLLGAVSSNTINQTSVIATGGRYKDYSMWAQDNFKLLPSLTLNLGLRYDIWTPYQEVNNVLSFFNPNLPNPAVSNFNGALQFAGYGPYSCNCTTNVNTYYGNFGPRVGLAYSINPKTVLRMGYAMMYTHRGAVGGRGGGRTGTDLIGYTASPSFAGVNSYTPAYYWNNGVPPYTPPPVINPAFGTGFVNGNTSAYSLNYGDPTIGGQPPRYQNWNVTLERSVGSHLLLGAAYVGSNGHHLGGGGRSIYSDQIDPRYLALGGLLQSTVTPSVLAQANAVIPGIRLPYPNFSGSLAQMLRPWPQYQNISDLYGDVGNSNYNSLQVYANQRLANGLTFNINYTFARAFDDTLSNMVTGQTPTAQTAYNWRIEKALTQIPAHSINALVTYQLPFGKGRQYLNNGGIVSHVVGGWQISTITTYRSGTPIGTFMTSGCLVPQAGSCFDNYNPNFTGPVRINGSWGSGNLLGSNTTPFLNSQAFLTPAPYTYGNTPRTNAFGITNPPSYGVDMNIKREFVLRERLTFSFQADAFNIFNLTNFSPPATNISSSAFGKITSQANNPRILQLSARIRF
ncbi:MAG: TonB-dependent receptor [Acidobacteriaceae bacterium]|nr:TonB-dependent receptor [Acidobacteriaceae bacterium]